MPNAPIIAADNFTEQLTGDEDGAHCNPMHSSRHEGPDDFRPPNSESSFNDDSSCYDFIKVKPYRVYSGHESDVVDVSWSKTKFILSASADKTVRLWHFTKSDCLRIFKHPQLLTSVEFHPEIDRYFVSGCFDRRVRLWDILPEGSVREYAQTSSIVRIELSIGYHHDVV
jgi:WD40 repeat protein